MAYQYQDLLVNNLKTFLNKKLNLQIKCICILNTHTFEQYLNLEIYFYFFEKDIT